MRKITLVALSLTIPSALSASAAIAVSPVNAPGARLHSVTFAIANMTCPTCPITVKTAMSGVHGVQSVKVDLGSKTATVAFDPRVTNAGAIAAASTNAGYPAKPKS